MKAPRYEIWTALNHYGQVTEDMAQANTRRRDAIKRAKFLVQDRLGWPNLVCVNVKDTRTGFVIYCEYRPRNVAS